MKHPVFSFWCLIRQEDGSYKRSRYLDLYEEMSVLYLDKASRLKLESYASEL